MNGRQANGTFAKGNPGRPVGAKDKRTEQWEKFSAFMLEAGLERFQREIELLEGEKFVQVVKDMMEYFKPKLARSEHTGKDGKDLPTPILEIHVPKNNSNQEDSSS